MSLSKACHYADDGACGQGSENDGSKYLILAVRERRARYAQEHERYGELEAAAHGPSRNVERRARHRSQTNTITGNTHASSRSLQLDIGSPLALRAVYSSSSVRLCRNRPHVRPI